jgi:repressor of nif and glnA expression
MKVQSLPEPALEIIALLAKENSGSLSSKEISKLLNDAYPNKAIKYALRRLLENKVIYRVPNLLDMRSVYYRLATQDELSKIYEHLSEDITNQIQNAIYV